MDTIMQSGAALDMAKMQSNIARADKLAATNANNKEAYRQVAQEFEGMFAQLLVDQMSQNIDTNGLTGGGNAEKIFRSMLNQEYGKAMAERGSLGIADHIYNQLMQNQEV